MLSLTWRGRGLSKQVISRVISTLHGFTPITTLLIALLTKSPAPPSKLSNFGRGVSGLPASGPWFEVGL